jgi:hypothetical protein
MVAWIQKFNRKTASVYNRTFVWPSSLVHEITLFQIGIRPTIYPAIWPSFSVSWRSPIEFVPTYFHTAAIQGLDGAWNSLWMRWAGISKTDGLEEHGWSAAWLNSLPHFLPMTNWLPPAQMDCKIQSVTPWRKTEGKNPIQSDLALRRLTIQNFAHTNYFI